MKTLLSPFLFLLSLLYGFGAAFDRIFRSAGSVSLPRPTISVGNLTVGGTGKTPILIRLTSDLMTLGIHPAILTRGYKGYFKKGSASAVVVGSTSSRKDGEDRSDEVILMAEKLPTVPIGVGADRRLSANEILKNHSCDAFLLDDGFQHWPLKRDLDVVCVDCTDPWGGGLIPLGRRRETLSQLRRAQAVILTRTDLVPSHELSAIESRLKILVPLARLFRTVFSPQLIWLSSQTTTSPAELYGKPVLALSAVGRPEAFERSLDRLGAFVTPMRFPDHHLYSEQDINLIEENLRKNGGFIITTEKDWSKLRRLRWGQKPPVSLALLRIEVNFVGTEERGWTSFLQEKIESLFFKTEKR